MTRRQLAQASETSERYLAQIESGAGNPSVSVLRAIAQALDLPAAALLPEHGRAHRRAWRHPRSAGAGAGEGTAGARQGDRGARGAARRRRPGAAHRARRPARRRQVDARPHAGAASRLALHRARPARRGGLRRQHSRPDRNGRHGDVPPPRARARSSASIAEHEAAIITTAGGIVSNPETYALLLRHTHTVWIKARPRRAYEPGDGAGRFPADGAEPPGHGRPGGDPRSAPRRLCPRRSRSRHLGRRRRAELCQASAHRRAVDRGAASRDARRRRLSRSRPAAARIPHDRAAAGRGADHRHAA